MQTGHRFDLIQISTLPASSYWATEISNQPLYSKRHLMDKIGFHFRPAARGWRWHHKHHRRARTILFRSCSPSSQSIPRHDAGAHISSPAIPAVPLRKSRTKVEYVQPSPANAGLQGSEACTASGRTVFELRSFVARSRSWAEQQAPVPWEVRFGTYRCGGRGCGFLRALIGAACDGCSWHTATSRYRNRWRPSSESIKSAKALPSTSSEIPIRLPLEWFLPLGLAVIWLIIRG